MGRFLRIVLVFMAIALSYIVLDSLSSVLLPFAIAWLVAYFIHPLVNFVQYRMRLKYRIPSIIVALLMIVVVISAVAMLVVPSIKRKHYVYRVGGDEFVILFLHADENVISDVVKKTDDANQKNGYCISTGYAMRGRDDSLDDVIKKSDEKMYEAKAEYYRSKGRTQRVSCYQVPEEKE